jgi:hypothetical protein
MTGPGDPAFANFFAYGIFRKGEIAFPVIERFVEAVEAATTRGDLLERDGVHLLDPRGLGSVEGDLIRFAFLDVNAAFAAIDALEPGRTYRWETCETFSRLGKENARVLVARSPTRGTHRAAEPYRSRDDPLFAEALDEVEAVLYPGRSIGYATEISDFFRYQMAYLLLWTAIERYCTLRWGFGSDPVQRVKMLAHEPVFAAALKRHVRERRTVYRADKPTASPEKLDMNDPLASVGFYYQVRSNIAHRGKSIHEERELVRSSLEQLTLIFREVLDETLGRRRS